MSLSMVANGYAGRVNQNRNYRPDEVIQDMPRTSPIMPHALVVQTVLLHDNEFRARESTVDPFYPISSVREVAVMMGEFAVTVPRHPTSIVNGNPNASDICVKTSANGMRLDEDIQAVGQMLTAASLEKNDKTDCTVQRAGPGTAQNSGEETIRAGEDFYLDWPAFLSKNGKLLPKHKRPGMPVTKFLWATRPYKPHEIMSGWAELAFKVLQVCATTNDVAEREAATADLHKEYSLFRHAGEDGRTTLCPARRWVQYLIHKDEANLSDVMKYDDTTRKAFEDGLSGTLSRKRFSNNNNTLAAKVRRVENGSTSGTTRSPTGKLALDVCYPLMLFTEQLNLYKKRMIGKAITTAAPGHNFDYVQGYGTGGL